jgi:PAS domain S-box-containing protein
MKTEDKSKTKAQLIEELHRLRKRNELLETEAGIRKATVQALVESRENYRILFETMAEGVVYQSMEGEILSANPAACRMLGLSMDQLLGRTSTDPRWHAVHEDGSPFEGERHPSMRAMRTGKPVNGVIMGVFNPREERYRWLIINAIPLYTSGEKKPYQVYTTFSDITELKEAQRALGDSEKRFRSIVEASPMGIHLYRLEEDGRLIFTGANPASDRILGVDSNQYIGKSIEQAFPALVDSEIPERYRTLCRSGEPWHWEQVEYEDDRVQGAFEVHAFQTSPNQIATLFLDITDRKKAEEAIRQNERKYRHLVKFAPAAIYEIDLNSQRFLSVNDVTCEYCGYTREEMLRMNPLELMTEESRARFIERNRRLLAGEEVPDSVEYQIQTKTRGVFWVLLNVKLLQGENGGLHALVVAHDISERRNAEIALRESEEKYRLLVEHASDSIFIAQDEVVKFPNPKTLEVIGYTEEELLHTPFSEIIHPDDRELVLERYKQRLMGGEPPSTYSFRVVKKNGEAVWMQLNTVLISWEGKPATLNFLRDVTTIRRLEAQVQAAQRMQSLGTLAGGIAHDFNNLLMGIQGRASLMLTRTESGHPLREHLHGIEEYVRSAADLTKQLLGLARGGKYEVRPTNLNRIASRCVEMFGRTHKEVNVHANYKEELWTVEVDKGQIEQVLINLLINAWHAMPEGVEEGDIFIETENLILDESFTSPYGLEAGRFTRLSVTDTGVGMDGETLNRVFDPFFTTRKRGRGTGLGLAAAYGIVKNHGGIITVDSEKGRGSTFAIYLAASRKSARDEALPDGRLMRGSGTVLLVDDEQVIVDVGQALLLELGYEVLVCRSGRDAIDIFQKYRESVTLVILDMIMPGLSGRETFSELRSIDEEVKILLSSGYSLDGQAKEIMTHGCNGFIQKPFNLIDLSQKIHAIIAT